MQTPSKLLPKPLCGALTTLSCKPLCEPLCNSPPALRKPPSKLPCPPLFKAPSKALCETIFTLSYKSSCTSLCQLPCKAPCTPSPTAPCQRSNASHIPAMQLLHSSCSTYLVFCLTQVVRNRVTSCRCDVRKEKTLPVGVSSMRSQLSYRLP